MLLDRSTAFDENQRTTTNQLVKQAIESAINIEQARSHGILRTGGNRHKKAGICALGVLFRDTTKLNPHPGGAIHVSRKELITEIQPGIKPPYYLKARIIAGEKVPMAVFQVAQAAFITTKDSGGFAENYAEGVRLYIQQFIQRVKNLN